MRESVMDWVGKMVALHRPQAPVLEVGSLDVNGSVRSLFPQESYLGIDMRAGPGVDAQMDILEAGLRPQVFGTAVTTETLEHIIEPWRALEEMYRALRPGGLFIGTCVFSWPIHEYPNDYWRVTPHGFTYLLGRSGFEDIQVEGEGDDPDRPIGVFATARK